MPSASAHSAHCTRAQAGEWWDAALSQCFNCKFVAITFLFSAMTLHSTDVVFGIAYDAPGTAATCRRALTATPAPFFTRRGTGGYTA